MKSELNQDIKNEFTLCVGFEGSTLTALRKTFNVKFVISGDQSADLDWTEFHALKSQHETPSMSTEMMACLSSVRASYLQFVDINSRRHYYVPGRESETYNGFMLTFYKVYSLIKLNQIKLVMFANIPHEGFDFVLYKVAEFLGINCIMCYQSLIPNRFWITNSMTGLGLFNNTPKIFEKAPSGYKLPQNWFYMKGSNRDAAYSFLSMAKETLGRIYRLPPALVRYVYARQFRAAVARLTSLPVKGEKYIYFPLHLQPELTTSALGGEFADQLLAIEILRAWLPSEYSIYLKENPKQTEKQRDPFFFKRLASLPNVKLLDRRENSIELIKGSIGVATITGTAGWEALFYGKPVIVFGAAWYREFSGVYEFKPILNLEEIQNTPIATHQKLVEELDAALQTAGKGIVDLAYAELLPEFDAHENGRLVVDSLLRHFLAKSSRGEV